MDFGLCEVFFMSATSSRLRYVPLSAREGSLYHIRSTDRSYCSIISAETNFSGSTSRYHMAADNNKLNASTVDRSESSP